VLRVSKFVYRRAKHYLPPISSFSNIDPVNKLTIGKDNGGMREKNKRIGRKNVSSSACIGL
jgi:hypothetical protein